MLFSDGFGEALIHLILILKDAGVYSALIDINGNDSITPLSMNQPTYQQHRLQPPSH